MKSRHRDIVRQGGRSPYQSEKGLFRLGGACDAFAASVGTLLPIVGPASPRAHAPPSIYQSPAVGKRMWATAAAQSVAACAIISIGPATGHTMYDTGLVVSAVVATLSVPQAGIMWTAAVGPR